MLAYGEAPASTGKRNRPSVSVENDLKSYNLKLWIKITFGDFWLGFEIVFKLVIFEFDLKTDFDFYCF